MQNRLLSFCGRLILLLIPGIIGAQSIELSRSVINNAGGMMTQSGSYHLTDVLGQATPPGFFSGPSYSLAAGFLGPLQEPLVEIDPTASPTLAGQFQLQQNYPNPFNPETVIAYSLAVHRFTTLAVYDLLGRRVRTLVSGNQPPGIYQVTWDGQDEAGREVAAGLYFYRLQADNLVKIRKMLLVR